MFIRQLADTAPFIPVSGLEMPWWRTSAEFLAKIIDSIVPTKAKKVSVIPKSPWGMK